KEIQRLAESVLVRRESNVRFDRDRLRLSNTAISAALAGDLKSGLLDLKALGIRPALAKSYLRAWQSRHEANLKLTRADVRRVFCIGIGLHHKSIIRRNP